MNNELQKTQVYQPEIMNREEIDIQIATAKKYPRNLDHFVKNATTLATQDIEIAASCNYRLERKSKGGGTKIIEGPSIRVAEIALHEYGNCRVYSTISEDGNNSVVAEGVFMDLEKNIATKEQVHRSVVTKTGQRYSVDMVNVTKNAACSIAIRNAILRGIPRAFVNKVAAEAKKVAIGNKSTIKSRIKLMFKKFLEIGVDKDMVLKKINKPTENDINLSDLETLIGLFAAISGGDATIEEQFSLKTSTKPNIKVEVTGGTTQPVIDDDSFLGIIEDLALQAGFVNKKDGSLDTTSLNQAIEGLQIPDLNNYKKIPVDQQQTVVDFLQFRIDSKKVKL